MSLIDLSPLTRCGLLQHPAPPTTKHVTSSLTPRCGIAPATSYHACQVTLLLQWHNLLINVQFSKWIKDHSLFPEKSPSRLQFFKKIHPLKIPVGQLHCKQKNAILQAPGKIFMKVPYPVSTLFTQTQFSSTLKGGSYELKGDSAPEKKPRKEVGWMAHCYILPTARTQGPQLNFIISLLPLPFSTFPLKQTRHRQDSQSSSTVVL